MIFIQISLFMILSVVSSEDIKCPQNEGIFAIPDDCQSFIMCSNSRAKLYKCPAGLHFNPTLKVCDFAEQSGCETEVMKTNVFDCREGDRLNQDPLDCHSFYMCSNGRSYHVRCQAGLIFYPQSGRCDYPESSGFNCFDSRNKFPNSSDCKTYFDCSQPINGFACPKVCPESFQFNRYLEECVYPEKSWCQTEGINNDREVSSDIDTNEPNDESTDDSGDSSSNTSDPSMDMEYMVEPVIESNSKLIDYMEINFNPNINSTFNLN